MNRCKHNKEGNDIKKEAAKENKETRKHLLECAGREFLEKGYMKASLRNICKEAGVTTGALYFFFKDKEDLFDAIVEPTLEKVKAMSMQHVNQELMALQNLPGAEEDDMHDDRNATEQILHVLYSDYDICQLLLTKSQGSKYENCLDTFVDIFETGQKALAVEQAKQLGVPVPDDYTLHWVIHIQLDAYVHVLLHEPDEQKALSHMDNVLTYLLSGWMALFRKKPE